MTRLIGICVAVWGLIPGNSIFATLSAETGEVVNLFDGTSLQDWEPVGDGLWAITAEGYLLGQRDPRRPDPEIPWFNSWKSTLNRSWLKTEFKVVLQQAWLYTREEFDEYDLHLEWWVPHVGNSGVSLRDRTRGRHTFGDESDLTKTPSQIAYEIQINNAYPDQFASGSIYSLVKAKEGAQRPDDWNSFDIEVRHGGLRVRLNGQLVAEHPGLPDRSKTGPIGLQLHDEKSLVMFRNIWLKLAR